VGTRLKNSEKYKDGFTPKLVEKELRKRFHNQFVFVSDMGERRGEVCVLQRRDLKVQKPVSSILS